MLRRAASEEAARKSFEHSERALGTEQATPTSAGVKATQTVAALGAKHLEDSQERGKAVRIIQGRESRLSAPTIPMIGDVPVSKWRIEHSRKVMAKASKTLDSPATRRTCAVRWPRCASSPGGLGWLDRPPDRPPQRTGDRPIHRPVRARRRITSIHGCGRRPARRGGRRRCALRARWDRSADDPSAALRHQDPRRRLRRPAPRRTRQPPRHRCLLRPRLRPGQRQLDHPARLGRVLQPGEEPRNPRGPPPPAR